MPILQLFNCDAIVSLIANLVRTNLFTYKKMCDMKIHGSLFFLKIDFININLLRFAHIFTLWYFLLRYFNFSLSVWMYAEWILDLFHDEIS